LRAQYIALTPPLQYGRPIDAQIKGQFTGMVNAADAFERPQANGAQSPLEQRLSDITHLRQALVASTGIPPENIPGVIERVGGEMYTMAAESSLPIELKTDLMGAIQDLGSGKSVLEDVMQRPGVRAIVNDPTYGAAFQTRLPIVGALANHQQYHKALDELQGSTENQGSRVREVYADVLAGGSDSDRREARQLVREIATRSPEYAERSVRFFELADRLGMGDPRRLINQRI
jgi:hypothetical protein